MHGDVQSRMTGGGVVKGCSFAAYGGKTVEVRLVLSGDHHLRSCESAPTISSFEQHRPVSRGRGLVVTDTATRIEAAQPAKIVEAVGREPSPLVSEHHGDATWTRGTRISGAVS
jgi:hypothetical protein